jgi:hypothetical protein
MPQSRTPSGPYKKKPLLAETLHRVGSCGRATGQSAMSIGPKQSRGHCAHIGQDVVIHYRWHPLYGRSARRIQGERRATGEFVHVELTPGVVTIVPAWKLDAVYCAGLKVGAPQVSRAALGELRDLLVACESRLVSADGNAVTQEAQDGISRTTCTKNATCSEAGLQATNGSAATRPRARQRKTAGHDAGGTACGHSVSGASHAGSARHRNAGGRR